MNLVTWMDDENWARSLALWNLFFFLITFIFQQVCCLFFFFFGLHDMWILSSLNRDRTHAEVEM